jgi:hypothetical protein
MPLAPAKRARLSRALRRIARKVDKLLEQETGERVGFSLVVWGTFGGDEMIQYVANADRPGCQKALEDLIASWRAGMPDVPYHERN